MKLQINYRLFLPFLLIELYKDWKKKIQDIPNDIKDGFQKFRNWIDWKPAQKEFYLYFSDFIEGPSPDPLHTGKEIRSTSNNVRYEIRSKTWETRVSNDHEWKIEDTPAKIATFESKFLNPDQVKLK